MKGLTKRQKEVLTFIQEYIHNNNYSPSYREIMQHFEFSSLGSVFKHISVLKRKGVLTSEKQCGRSLIPTEFPHQNHTHLEIELPFLGHISAGAPIETFPQSQTLEVPEFLVHAPEITYVIRARGDSLHDELIADGDLLLVEARSDANPGDTIVGTIEGDTTVIKKYHPEGHNVRLTSSSSPSESLTLRHESLQIQGIIVGVLRLCS